MQSSNAPHLRAELRPVMMRQRLPSFLNSAAFLVTHSVPLIILFLIFHKKIMAGVARGGTKG